MSPAEERWHSLMLDASSGKLGAPFPEGQLTDMQILEPTEGIRQYQWYYEPTTTGGMGAIEIDVYFSLPKPDVHKAMEMYTSSKQEALESKPWRQEGKEVDGWVDWPKRYPNRNEYETMEACGMIKSGKKVAWVQGGYFVELSGGPLMEEGGLEEYADGVWLVVNGAGEEVEGLKKDDDEEEEEE